MFKQHVPKHVVEVDFIRQVIDEVTRKICGENADGPVNENMRTEIVTFGRLCASLILEEVPDRPDIMDPGWRQKLCAQTYNSLERRGLPTHLNDALCNIGERFPLVFRTNIAQPELLRMVAFVAQTAVMLYFNEEPHELDTLHSPGEFSVHLFDSFRC